MRLIMPRAARQGGGTTLAAAERGGNHVTPSPARTQVGNHRAMRSSRLVVLVALASLAGLGLTACSSAPLDDQPKTDKVEEATIDPSVELPEPGTGDVCILDAWSADLPGLAAQMEADLYADDQLDVLAADVTIDGEIQWIFEADHTFQWGGPATFTTYVADTAGMEMTVSLEYGGTVTGTWVYDNPEMSRIVIGGIDTSLHTVTPTVTVNGVRMDDPSVFDAVVDAAPGPGPVEITCGGGSLLTQPAGSPYVTEWLLSR